MLTLFKAIRIPIHTASAHNTEVTLVVDPPITKVVVAVATVVRVNRTTHLPTSKTNPTVTTNHHKATTVLVAVVVMVHSQTAMTPATKILVMVRVTMPVTARLKSNTSRAGMVMFRRRTMAVIKGATTTKVDTTTGEAVVMDPVMVINYFIP